MDDQKKQLIGLILRMLKDVYDTTIGLEKILDSNSVHILSRDFDPFLELLATLEISEDKNALLSELVQLYLENQMTLDELLIEIENQIAGVHA